MVTSQQRFTRDGSQDLEQSLNRLCQRILAGVQAVVPRNKLQALVLGGGYGRGEGGVLRTPQGDRPYNDLEFYVFVAGNRFWNERVYGPPLSAFAQKLSPEADLHIEFKIDSLDHMRCSPISLFSYDLITAHRSLFGNEGMFQGCEHHLQADAIPLSEASRLLFNRCTGLLLVRELLRHECRVSSVEAGTSGSCAFDTRNSTHLALSPDEADFIGRNLAKTQLCLGDALLVAFGQYHWSCLERARRFDSLTAPQPLPWLEEARAHHSDGVQFKLHPVRVLKSEVEFEQEYRRLSDLALKVWLWLENRRLDSAFTSIHDYAFQRAARYPGRKSWRNYLLNLRTFGFKAAFAPLSWRYPRERLFNAMPLLLWNGEVSTEPEIVQFLQRQLVTRAADWTSLVSAYKQIWPRYG